MVSLFTMCSGPAAAFATPTAPTERKLTAIERATFLLKAGRWHEAIAAFDAALAMGTERTIARLGRASALAALGREDDARAEVARLIERGLDTPVGALVIARWAMYAGDVQLAMGMLGVGLRAQPDLAAVAGRDPAFRPLADHPLFLQITGQL